MIVGYVSFVEMEHAVPLNHLQVVVRTADPFVATGHVTVESHPARVNQIVEVDVHLAVLEKNVDLMDVAAVVDHAHLVRVV